MPPTTTLVQGPSRGRCHSCSGLFVEHICHHCGRPLCRPHSSWKEDPPGWAHKEFARFVSRDSRAGQAPAHCSSCDHPLGGRLLSRCVVASAVVLLAVGLWTGSWVLAALSVVAGGLVAPLEHSRRTAMRSKWTTSFPLIGVFDSVAIVERLRQRLRLDEQGQSQHEQGDIEGTISVKAQVTGNERGKIEEYCNDPQVRREEPPTLHAGFLLLTGSVRMESEPGASMEGNVLTLMHDLSSPEARSSLTAAPKAKLDFTHRYRVPADTALPWPIVSVVPALGRESDRRVLDLTIQWEEPPGDGGTPSNGRPGVWQPLRLEEVSLSFPAAWGEVEVEFASDSAYFSQPGETGESTIQCRRLILDEDDLVRRSRTISLTFENRIDPSARVCGTVDMALAATFSGIEDAELFYPLGTPRKRFMNPGSPLASPRITGRRHDGGGHDQGSQLTDVQTRIMLDFELSLGCLRYQDVERLNDPIPPLSGVVADHANVIELTRLLADAGLHVSRLVENPPHPGERPGETTHSWDISGRRYNNVYPVDFHIVMAGAESSDPNSEPETRLALTVSGSFANPSMRAMVKSVQETILDIVNEKLASRRRSA